MAFAVEEINRNSMLLPNISLGYNLYDSCGNLWNSLSAALSMTSGSGEHFQLNDSCYGYPPVLGIVGDSSSTRTIAISNLVSLYRVPMVSCDLIFKQTRFLVDDCHYVLNYLSRRIKSKANSKEIQADKS